MKSLLLIFFMSVQVFAKGGGETTIRYYNDGETQVLSPHLKATTSVYSDSIELGAGYSMDVLSSSSSDVKSWASSSKISDTRKEYDLTSTLEFRNGSVGASYIQSDETDYSSKTVGIGTSRDFFEKNTTVAIGASFGSDVILHAKDPKFEGLMKNANLNISLTQVLSRVSLMQFQFDHRVETGFLSSPYRVARLKQPDGSILPMPENSPNVRSRNAFTFRYNYFWNALNVSLANSVRLYYDNWGVRSYTVEPKVTRELSKSLSLSADLRWYQQYEANFYKDTYDRADFGVFTSGNKSLSTFRSMLIGASPIFKFGGSWELVGRYEYYKINFANYTNVGIPQDPTDDKMYELTAQVFGVGLSKEF